jgi:hypothetical protein
MPNRKTFDEREKYDHSSHPVRKRQPSDLKADIPDAKDETVTPAEPAESPSAERRTSSTFSKRR